MNKSRKLKKIKNNKSKSKSFNKHTRKGGTNKTRRFRGGSKFKCNVTRKTPDNFDIDCNPLKVTFDLAAKAATKKAEAATKKAEAATKKAEAEAATTKIQAIARRRRATKKVETKKVETKKAEATTRIQAIARRKGATKRVETKKAEAAATTKKALDNAISEAEKTLGNALNSGFFQKYFTSDKSKIKNLKKVLLEIKTTKQNKPAIKSTKIDELMKEINTLINADDVKKAETAAKSLNSELNSELKSRLELEKEINGLDEDQKNFYNAALEYDNIKLKLNNARDVKKPHTENDKKLIEDLLTEKKKKQKEKLSLRKNVNMNKREKVSNLIKKYHGGKRTRHNKKYTKKTRKHRKDN